MFQRDGSVFHGFVRVSGMCLSVARCWAGIGAVLICCAVRRNEKGNILSKMAVSAHRGFDWLCRNTVAKVIN